MHGFQLNASVVCLDTPAIILCQKNHQCSFMRRLPCSLHKLQQQCPEHISTANPFRAAPWYWALCLLQDAGVAAGQRGEFGWLGIRNGDRGEKASIFVFFPVVVEQNTKICSSAQKCALVCFVCQQSPVGSPFCGPAAWCLQCLHMLSALIKRTYDKQTHTLKRRLSLRNVLKEIY